MGNNASAGKEEEQGGGVENGAGSGEKSENKDGNENIGDEDRDQNLSASEEAGSPYIEINNAFTDKETKKLKGRFLKLSHGEDKCSVESFLMMPEMAFNPMVPRCVEVVLQNENVISWNEFPITRPYESKTCINDDEEGMDLITFGCFVKILSIFSNRCPVALKRQIAFQLFDYDSDGKLCERDLVKGLQMIFPLVPEGELEETAEEIMDACNVDREGFISPHDFAEVFDFTGFNMTMTILY